MGNEILSEKELEHIKTHKYNTTGYSWLDNKMNPFWIKCASMLPHVKFIFIFLKIVAKSQYGDYSWIIESYISSCPDSPI